MIRKRFFSRSPHLDVLGILGAGVLGAAVFLFIMAARTAHHYAAPDKAAAVNTSAHGFR